MKKLLIILVSIVAVEATAQRNPQTLVGDGVEFTSGFGGFMLQFPTIDGRLTAMTGGGGAALINNTFYFGGYGLGLAEDLKVEFEGDSYDVDFGHGGFYTGFIAKPDRLVHLVIGSRFGWGTIRLHESFFGGNGGYTEINDNVFVVDPSIMLELNITEWFKFNLGGGYQFTTGVNNPMYDDKDFNGATINASFLFGWFR